MRDVGAILWHDLLSRTVCRALGHYWRMVPMGRHHPALTCRVCKDFRAPSRAGG